MPRYSWEDLYGPKPTPEQLTPITVGCTVTYNSPSLWGYRYTVTRVEGRRVRVRRPDGGEHEEHDANLRIVTEAGEILVNTTRYTDWEQHYQAARAAYERMAP